MQRGAASFARSRARRQITVCGPWGTQTHTGLRAPHPLNTTPDGVGVARAFPPPCARATGGMPARRRYGSDRSPGVVDCCFDDVAPLPLSTAMFHYDCILSVSRVLWCVGPRARSSPGLGPFAGQTPPPAPPGLDGSAPFVVENAPSFPSIRVLCFIDIQRERYSTPNNCLSSRSETLL